MQKLAFLEMDQDVRPILTSEAKEKMYMFTLHKNLGTEFRDLVSHSSLEQIIKYDNNWLGWINRFFYWYSTHISIDTVLSKDQAKKWRDSFKNFRIAVYAIFFSLDKRQVNLNLIRICAVPFVYFNTYSIHPEDKKDEIVDKDKQNSAFRKPKSEFLELALEQHENDIFRQGDTVLEVLLQYKWKTFARKRFFLIYAIHIIYYVSYSVGVLFAIEVFNYTLGTPISGKHFAPIILMFFSAGTLFIQEVRQFLKYKRKVSYFLSLYKLFDLIAIILPIITFWQMLYNKLGLVCT